MPIGQKPNNPFDDAFDKLQAANGPLSGDILGGQVQPIGGTAGIADQTQASPDAEEKSPIGNVHPGFFSTAENNIKNPVLRNLAKIGDVAGRILVPGITANIPGTKFNEQQQENRELGIEGQKTKQAAQEAQAEHAQAETTEIPLHEKNEEERLKQADELKHHNYAIALRKQGLKLDESGQPAPLEYADMSPTEQAAYDLKDSTTKLKEAQAELAKHKGDPNSPEFQMAAARLRVLQENARTAAGRLGLSGKEFNAKYLGVGPDNEPLAGVATDENGNPIGPAVANSNAPTAQRLNKADLAGNVQSNVADIKKMIDENPELFGKISGRFTTFREMMGSDDPAIAKIGVAGHNAAMASNGIHGLRSAEAVDGTEKRLLNHFKNGPVATKAALDEMAGSVGQFIEDAKHGKRVNTGGATTPKPKANSGNTIVVSDEDLMK